MLRFVYISISMGRSKAFLFDWSFLLVIQSSRSSPIATKGFVGAVRPLF